MKLEYPAIRVCIKLTDKRQLEDDLLRSIKDACRDIGVSVRIEAQEDFLGDTRYIVVTPTSQGVFTVTEGLVVRLTWTSFVLSFTCVSAEKSLTTGQELKNT